MAVNYMPTNEPITEDVLRDVAGQLQGAEWSTVAAALGLTRPRIQVIQRNAMLRSSPPLVVNFEMLMMWTKALPKSADKVRIRRQSFVELGDPTVFRHGQWHALCWFVFCRTAVVSALIVRADRLRRRRHCDEFVMVYVCVCVCVRVFC